MSSGANKFVTYSLKQYVMNTTATNTKEQKELTPSELLEHWQGHRKLTRRVIEAFPEKEFFEFSIGGMRACADLMRELLSIGMPGIRQAATGKIEKLDHDISKEKKKENFLKLWDESTELINKYWAMIPEEKFSAEFIAFGEYPGTLWSSIFYFIDNEIHHRGQAYVYLRALGIEPPAFYER